MMPNARRGKGKRKFRKVRAWADMGSHGGIFIFHSGPAALLGYRTLMHIYNEPVTPDLVPVTITYKEPRR
jgi:hypothetical protein